MPAFMDLNGASAFGGMKPLYTKGQLVMPRFSPAIYVHEEADKEDKFVAPDAMQFLQRTVSAHATQMTKTNALQADNTALTHKVDVLQDKHDNLLEETLALRESYLDLEKRNDLLASEIVESNGLLMMADTRLTEAEGHLADALHTLASQHTMNATYKTQNDDLTSRIEALETQHAFKQFELETVQTFLGTAEARIDSLQAQLTKAQEEEETLRNELQSLAIDGIDNLQKIMTLEDQLDITQQEKVSLTAKLEAELLAAKNEKAALVRKLEKTVEEFNQLEQEASTSRLVLADTRLDLELSQQALSLAQEQVDICERAKTSLSARVEDLSAQIASLQLESAELKETLRVVEAQAKAEADHAMVNLHLEQEKTKALKHRLVESDERLASATHKVNVLEHEASELKAAEESSRIDMFAKQLEVDLLVLQEQEALDAVDTERKAREAAEKERDDMAANIAQLLAEMEAMKVQQQTLQERNAALEKANELLEDRNQVFELQLGRECDAHAGTRDDLDRMQTRLASVIADKENQPATIKSSTPARRESTIFRRQKTPLQSRNVDFTVPSLASLPAVPASVRIKDDVHFTKESSPIVRSPTIPLASTPASVSLHRRSSSSVSTYRSFSDRLFGRSTPDSRGPSPLMDSDFFSSPALS